MEDRNVLGRILEDIVTIEINTIVCNGMTGEQMVDPRHALFDIGVEYIEALRKLGADLDSLPDTCKKDDKPVCGSKDVFSKLYEIARDFESTQTHTTCTPRQVTLVNRIKVKSGQIVALFDRLKGETNEFSRSAMNDPDTKKPMVLGHDDRVFIRKIWELGTEEVVMQTVITLDGDVVSRVQRDFASKDHDVLHRLHGEGIKIALSTWATIIETIKAVTMLLK